MFIVAIIPLMFSSGTLGGELKSIRLTSADPLAVAPFRSVGGESWSVDLSLVDSLEVGAEEPASVEATESPTLSGFFLFLLLVLLLCLRPLLEESVQSSEGV